MTSWETLGSSVRLHANMSLLCQRKLLSSLSYLGFKPAPILMVLVGSSASIFTALASSIAFKTLDKGVMAGPSDADGTQRPSSLISVVACPTRF
jgi:hypothetical protein